MSTFFAMVRRELKSVKKEKTIMIAILIQLFIASFSSVIAVGLMSLYDPDTIGQNTQITVRAGIVGDSGQIDTIIFAPRNNTDVVNMKLILPDLDSKATVILMVLKEPLKRYENYLREVNGVHVIYNDIQGRPPRTYEFIYSLIIPMLMLFPALLAGSLVIDTVSEETENKTLDTLRSTPVSLNEVFAAKISAAIIMVLIQCIMWAMLLRLNNLPIQNLGLILLLCIVIGAFISIVAAIISLYFKDRERSQFVYSIALIVTAGLSCFLHPSPFSLMARLATGDCYIGMYDIMLYVMPLIVLGAIFPMASRKLVSTRG
jgi:ABC-2 type transport system permease protein